MQARDVVGKYFLDWAQKENNDKLDFMKSKIFLLQKSSLKK